jgi:hypothetical protein
MYLLAIADESSQKCIALLPVFDHGIAESNVADLLCDLVPLLFPTPPLVVGNRCPRRLDKQTSLAQSPDNVILDRAIVEFVDRPAHNLGLGAVLAGREALELRLLGGLDVELLTDHFHR